MKRNSVSQGKYAGFFKKPKMEMVESDEDVDIEIQVADQANVQLIDPEEEDVNAPEPPTQTDVKPKLIRAGWGKNYQIDRTIGSGVYGNVFQVTDLETKNKYALKVLKLCFQDSQDLFDGETKIMKKVAKGDHKNMVNLVHSGDLIKTAENCSTLAILMNLCGPSIFGVISHVRAQKPQGYITFPIPDIRKVGFQVLEAMKYLESINVYHLDLKPENIFFSSPDSQINTLAEELGTVIQMNDLHVRVGDFGCSQFSNKKPPKKSETVQTQNYRSPEIMLGLPHTKKSDVWSFGCVLNEMYTGELLFYGNTFNDTEFVQFAMMQRILCRHPSPKMWREALRIKSSKVVLSSEDVPCLKGRVTNGCLKVKPLFTQLRKGDLPAADLYVMLHYLFEIDPEYRPSFHKLAEHSFFKDTVI